MRHTRNLYVRVQTPEAHPGRLPGLCPHIGYEMRIARPARADTRAPGQAAAKAACSFAHGSFMVPGLTASRASHDTRHRPMLAAGGFFDAMTASRIDFSALDFLLIEENYSSRDMTGEMLRGFGVKRLREARSIEAAMRDIERRAPDIILCDWMTRPTDGLSFLRRLRADPTKPYANALVIMINEQASSDHIQAALGEGADGYIVKPFRPATLLDHLVQAITAQRMRPVE